MREMARIHNGAHSRPTMNPENFDLNLIRVFLAVARHRNVTEASRRLHLTQSSVSHALARLRTVCKDPLFVRSSGGMVPTAAALAMIEPLELALKSIRHSLRGATPFDPAMSDRRFKLLLTDVGQLTYLPPLLEYLGSHAPQIGIQVLHLPMDAYQASFVKGEADMAIGYLPTLYSGFHRQKLFEAPQVCMLRADHPHIGGSISLEQYLAATHILVEPPGRGPGVVEKALSRARLQRKVAVRLPNVFAGPLIVRRTDHVMTVPAHTRFLHDELAGLQFLPLPLEVETMDIELLWHERTQHEPGNQWLRGVVCELFSRPAAKARRKH
jgi:DNA-binding transcriptional LysR family regulator